MRNKPNLVLLHVDQWRGDCLGVDGHPDVLTPTLDGLATGGVCFQHAYTDCPTQPDVPVDWELTKEELEQAAYRGVRPYL